MNKELINTTIAAIGVAAVGYALYHFKVHAWKVNVVPVGNPYGHLSCGYILSNLSVTWQHSIIGTYNSPFDRVMNLFEPLRTIVQLKRTLRNAHFGFIWRRDLTFVR